MHSFRMPLSLLFCFFIFVLPAHGCAHQLRNISCCFFCSPVHFVCPFPCDRVTVCMSRVVVFGTMPSFWICLIICCLPRTEAYLYNVFFFSERAGQTMSAVLLIKREKILETNKVLAQGKVNHACVVSSQFSCFLCFSVLIYLVARIISLTPCYWFVFSVIIVKETVQVS